MSWASKARLLQGHATRVFGTPTQCVYEPDGLANVSIDGIFRRDAEIVDGVTGSAIATEGPVLDIRIADIGQDPRREDRVTVPAIPDVHPIATRYAVQRVAKDGEGAATLYLHEKATG